MSTSVPRRRLITQLEAAEYLKCTDRTIRNMVTRGELKAYRIGRMIRLDLNEVEATLRPIPTAQPSDVA